MPDEAPEAPAVEQDTPEPESPEVEAPETDTPEPATDDTTDWRDRYQNLQPEYTRATQEAAQYRQILDLARQGDKEALEILRDAGVPVAEADTEEEGDDYKTPEEQIAELKSWKEQFEAQQQQEAEEAQLAEAEERFIKESIEALESDEGTEFSDDYKDMLTYQALRFESEQDGLPDFEAAHKSLQEWAKQERQRFIESKKNAATPPSGGPGDESIDTSTPQGRHDAVLAVAEASNAAAEE